MPWDPMRDLLTMQERFESLFGRTTPGWVPPADLTEFADRYVLTVELAGFRLENAHVDFVDDVLTVSGARPATDCCPERYQQLERGQGRFSRSFRFAQAVNGDAIAADLTNGLLTVVVPKLVVPSRIEVS